MTNHIILPGEPEEELPDFGDNAAQFNNDQKKHMLDFLKHLSTLTTGAMLVYATLIEKVITPRPSRLLNGVVFGLLLTSLTLNIVAMVGVLQMHSLRGQPKRVFGAISVTGMLSFLIALLMIIVAVI